MFPLHCTKLSIQNRQSIHLTDYLFHVYILLVICSGAFFHAVANYSFVFLMFPYATWYLFCEERKVFVVENVFVIFFNRLEFSATFASGTLSLTDLVNKIYVRLQEDLFEGLELHATKDGSEAACKILKIIGSGNTTSYEVGWIGQDNAVISTSVLTANDLIRKKAPSGRNMLKLFIRESTSQNSPWIVHANLANKYGIPTEPPKDIMVTIFPCFFSFLLL